jgi:hypothetical protein
VLQAVYKGVDRAQRLHGDDGSPNPVFLGQAQLMTALNEIPEADHTKKQWLKRMPQTRSIGRNHYGLVYEWWFARRWSYATYAGDNEDGNP